MSSSTLAPVSLISGVAGGDLWGKFVFFQFDDGEKIGEVEEVSDVVRIGLSKCVCCSCVGEGIMGLEGRIVLSPLL